jgi:signal transduction histidine kinase
MAAMTNGSEDGQVSKLMSVSSHEMRNSLGVAVGYVRFIMGGRGGDVSEQQRQWLEEVIKALGRLGHIAEEMSELGKLEGGKTELNLASVDLRDVLVKAADTLPPQVDRDITIKLTTSGDPAVVRGDAARLTTAFKSILMALRRELVTHTELFVQQDVRPYNGHSAAFIRVGDPELVETLGSTSPSALVDFNDSRGGCGMSLPLAQIIVQKHGGAIWSLPTDSADGSLARSAKHSALIVLPLK